ncbi:hypothetical protein K469DRAFT_711318 [Zopfia rhizophila CBS 207.26]|uniref:RRM domain-containing protein n=1 Tax=Zopfia rhizophila CBS 207.26 TaxID=1314779 RepID=A0A6A6DX70_9PEZI|nr:hypothetical protein K469DRAFT_711318 [Zopfia rhizophila CBS 207.26]
MPAGRAFASTNWRARDPSFKSIPDPQSSTNSDHQNEFRSQKPRLWGNGLERERRMRREERKKMESTRGLAEGGRIYVGNMPYMAKKSDVEALFEEAGLTIENIDISIDPFTARNPSYCFVDLVDDAAATSAMSLLNGKNFLGRPLKVKPCIQKLARLDPSTLQNDRIFNRWQKAHLQEGVRLCYFQQGEIPSDVYPIDLLDPVREERRLYVGGLPKPLDQHTSDAEIRKLFADFNIEAVSKVKSPPESLKHKPGNGYYVFVDFSCKEEARAAARATDGQMALGGKLRVNFARSVPRTVSERGAAEIGDRNKLIEQKVFANHNRATFEEADAEEGISGV